MAIYKKKEEEFLKLNTLSEELCIPSYEFLKFNYLH